MSDAGARDLWAEVLSPLRWEDGAVVMLDQRLLPTEERWNRYRTAEEVATAIRELVIRGAPAIGCAAAMGLAAAALRYPEEPEQLRAAFDRDVACLDRARPTAVNLVWATRRQRAVFVKHAGDGLAAVQRALLDEAIAIWHEDIDFCRAIGRHGHELIPDGARVLTHCNAGALATGGYGTALGVIRGAVEAGKRIEVFADETRPFLQGARLTAWELARSGIDVTLICDNMAGSLMQQGAITHCVVGSDRIAANGDVANKIGTYMVAVLAKRHEIPFIVAAPRSTIDLETPAGAEIPIEERPPREVTHVGETQLAPDGVPVRNIAFDVTPAELVAAIVTEVGVARPPYGAAIAALMREG